MLGDAQGIDSAKMNMAYTFVNAFVHVGMQSDYLMLKKVEKNDTP